jgi:hypothetical protein
VVVTLTTKHGGHGAHGSEGNQDPGHSHGGCLYVLQLITYNPVVSIISRVLKKGVETVRT